MHHDELHRPQRRLDVLGVGVALGDVLALHVEPLERPADRGVEHVGDAQPGLGLDAHAPQRLVDLAHLGPRHVPVPGQLVRERAHVARPLHVVLPAQWVHPDALAAEVAGEHREVGHAHDHRRALAVLGDAEAVVDRRVGPGGVQPCGRTQLGCRDAGLELGRLGRVLGSRDELEVGVGVLAAGAHELLVPQPLGDDDVAHRVDEGDVGAGPHRQVEGRLDVRGAHQVDASGVGHDDAGTLPHPALHPRREHRVGVGRVGADHEHDVGVLDARRSPGCRQTCRRRGSGHSRWGSGRPARRCRCCCCRTPPAPSSGRRRPPRWCTATTRCRRSHRRRTSRAARRSRWRPARWPPPTRPHATRRRSSRAPSATSAGRGARRSRRRTGP